MDRARRNGDEFARPNDNLPIRKFDNQFPIDAKKCLVGVRMLVPGELLGHDAHADFVIVHLVERNIPIGVRNCLAERDGTYQPRARRAAIGHGSSLAEAIAWK